MPHTSDKASLQVLDATTGCRTNQFSLLKKRDFRRSPWIHRLFHSLCRQRKKNNKIALNDKEERSELLRVALQEIQQLENPETYHQVLLYPFIAVAEKKCDTDKQRHTVQLFSQLISLILETSAVFLKRAQEQEVELGPKEHYRALTNYWVYLILKTVYEDDDSIHPLSNDVYAYSFIYPYSDDLMDETVGDVQQKLTFCKNITTKILGGSLQQYALDDDGAALHGECRVYELLDQILSKSNSHSLRESFCAINHAQLASMKQRVHFEDLKAGVNSLSKDFEECIFDISVNKGVASVMPDAHFCFTDGSLSKEQAELAAMIGTMGQFINDIEGLFQDLDAKSLTPALISFLKHGTLDRFVEKSLTHMERQMRRAPRQYKTLSQDRVELLLNVVKIRLLIAAACLHETNPNRNVLSADFCLGLEEEMGLELSMFALLGRLERQVFGNMEESTRGPLAKNQLSSPEHFRLYIIEQTKKLLV